MATIRKQNLANGNGGNSNNGRSSNGDGARYLSLINSGAIALLIAIMAGFWSLADPRSELKNIRDNYLSLREHNVYADRIGQDLSRLDKAEHDRARDYVPQREFVIVRNAQDALVLLLEKRIEASVSKAELLSAISNHQIVLDSIRRELDQVDKTVSSKMSMPISGQIGVTNSTTPPRQ